MGTLLEYHTLEYHTCTVGVAARGMAWVPYYGTPCRTKVRRARAAWCWHLCPAHRACRAPLHIFVCSACGATRLLRCTMMTTAGLLSDDWLPFDVKANVCDVLDLWPITDGETVVFYDAACDEDSRHLNPANAGKPHKTVAKYDNPPVKGWVPSGPALAEENTQTRGQCRRALLHMRNEALGLVPAARLHKGAASGSSTGAGVQAGGRGADDGDEVLASPLALAVDRGVVPALVALLSVLVSTQPGAADRVMQCYVLQILHCVAGVPHLAQCLLRDRPPRASNAVPLLAACLESTSPCVRLTACTNLGYLVSAGPDARVAVRADESCVAALACYAHQRATSRASVCEGTRALMYVCHGCTDPRLAGRLLRVLRFLLQAPFEQALCDACRAIGYVAAAVGASAAHAALADDASAAEAQAAASSPDSAAVGSCGFRTGARAPGIVAGLVSLFGHMDSGVAQSALHAAAELVEGHDPAHVELFVAAGALGALADLLGGSAGAQRAVCRVLVHLAVGGSDAHVHALMHVRDRRRQLLVVTVIALAATAAETTVRADAVHVLGNLCLRGDEGRVARIRQLVDSKPHSALAVICAAVASPHARLHRTGLTALCGLVVNGKSRRGAEATYVDMCASLGAGRACESLCRSADAGVAGQAASMRKLFFCGVDPGPLGAP